jgi:transcriptional regulator with XRE-family HTH domain
LHDLVDARAVLTQALARARVPAAEFAARGGTSRSALSHYLAGRRSPTVQTLGRLLAGSGLQLRVTLEPLLAHVDERLDAMLAGEPAVDLAALASAAASFAVDHGHGPVRWAVDGASALNLHGLAVEHPFPTVVVQWDDATKLWLFRGLMRSTTPVEDGSWMSWDLERAEESMRGPVVGRSGMLSMRPVAQLPPVLMVQPDGARGLVVPVVAVDEVERTRPDLAEVLARHRERRYQARDRDS